ncbi:MAG: PD-(D/E)XK nuclease family protein [Gemmatimonadetes bacterium]|nr:PD-(D/E)XK nuclease family protein [Gemmatimonadota bacterium]
MRIPDQPVAKALKHLSPSLYEAVLACKARAAWIAFGNRTDVPQHPRALLGTCVHSVVESVQTGGLQPRDDETRRAVAREAFDRKAKDLYDRAHPLLRAKFPAPERIPYYYLFRERAALLALDAAARQDTARTATAPLVRAAHAQPAALVETKLTSRDGLLVGRPDYVDVSAGEVVDYKTAAGPEDDPAGLLDSEARQLRLYVHLARELGLKLTKGAVVRANGRRVDLEISEADAAAEGERARVALRAFNAHASEDFERLATPSPQACRYCPCIPFCDAFWQKATPAWADQCGTQVEGTVSGVSRAVVQKIPLITVELAITRGTTMPGEAVVQQLPERWACGDGTPPPKAGDVVRVVNGRLVDDAEGVAVIRPDRLTTAFWTLHSAMPANREHGTNAENGGSAGG